VGGVPTDATLRLLKGLLYLTAATTAAVELLIWVYAPEAGFALAVRTGWAMLRTIGWLVLVRQVRLGRAGAGPLGLILAVTTVFAVGRLVVPREGLPSLPGALGFAVLTALCLTVVVMLHRHPGVVGHLVRYPRRLVLTRDGVGWTEAPPRRPQATGWLLTARVASFTYSPLVLVPALVGAGELVDRPEWLLGVIFWVVAGVGVTFPVAISAAFIARAPRWPRSLLAWTTVGILAIDLPLCRLVLGVDGLVRDGTPLAVAGVVTLWALWRAPRLPADSTLTDTAVPR
jgi:hypothetical protein